MVTAQCGDGVRAWMFLRRAGDYETAWCAHAAASGAPAALDPDPFPIRLQSEADLEAVIGITGMRTPSGDGVAVHCYSGGGNRGRPLGAESFSGMADPGTHADTTAAEYHQFSR